MVTYYKNEQTALAALRRQIRSRHLNVRRVPKSRRGDLGEWVVTWRDDYGNEWIQATGLGTLYAASMWLHQHADDPRTHEEPFSARNVVVLGSSAAEPYYPNH